jgi:hypothetical protein
VKEGIERKRRRRRRRRSENKCADFTACLTADP